MHLNKLEREENLVSAFSFFDKDGSGYITIDELQQACKEFGLSEAHLDEMIKEIDQDNVSFFLFSLVEMQHIVSMLFLKWQQSKLWHAKLQNLEGREIERKRAVGESNVVLMP